MLCTYYRCRNGREFESIVDAVAVLAEGYESTGATIGTNSVTRIALFHKLTFPDEPAWVQFFDRTADSRFSSGTRSRHHSGIAVVEHGQAVYILCFGSSHQIPKRLPIEHRFGKICVSNQMAADDLRGIVAKTSGSIQKLRIERRTRSGPSRQLEMPRESHGTHAISGKVRMLMRDLVATGNKGLRGAAPADIEELLGVLTELEEAWNGGLSTNPELSALDRIEPVEDEGERDILTSIMHQAFLNDEQESFSFLPVGDDFWSAHSLEYVINRKRFSLHALDDSYIFQLMKVAHQKGHQNPFEIVIEATSAENFKIRATIESMTSFEYFDPNSSDIFVFEDGDWYRAKKSWRDRVLEDTKSLLQQGTACTSRTSLPKAILNEKEAMYIKRTEELQLAGITILHLKFPDGSLRMELCDLLVGTDTLVFLKSGKGRKAVEDVCQQAREVATALSDPASGFCSKVQDLLRPYGLELDIRDRSRLTFVAGLVVGPRAGSALTIRSQSALSDFRHEVERLGFRAAAALI